MLKRRQDGPPKFPIFFKNRPKNLAITVFGPRCLLEAFKNPQEPPKSFLRISQEAPQSPQESPKSPQKAPMQPPRGFQMGGLLHVHVTAFRTLVMDMVKCFPPEMEKDCGYNLG